MNVSAVQTNFQSASEIIARLKHVSTSPDLNKVEQDALSFLSIHGKELHRLYEAKGYAEWDLFTVGGEEVSTRKSGEDKAAFEQRLEALRKQYLDAVDRADKALLDFKNNPDIASKIVLVYGEKDKVRDPFLRRQVALAYPNFSEYKVDPALQEEIEKRTNKLKSMYGDFALMYKGKRLTDSELDSMIRTSTDPKVAVELVKLKLSIGNHKKGGEGLTIAEEILEVVKLRNLFARKAGSQNFYSYELRKQEINEAQLVHLMKDVKDAIKPIYDRLRRRMDIAVMKRYGVSEAEARLPYFQGGVRFPRILDDVMSFSSDDYLKGKDPRPILKKIAREIGADVDAIVDRSDLFPRPGKNPWWYLFPLKIPGDIRSFGNIDPNFQDDMGMVFSTECHEVEGHSIGSSFVHPELPPLFRNLHTITTEADAMMMEYLMYNEHCLRDVFNFDEETIQTFLTLGEQYKLAEELVTFFHNYLLITDFERELYHLKDEDLTLNNVNKLWTEKVGEYLGIETPKDRNEPDWAYKIHIATAPVYYQNYFLGQLVRAQDTAKINELAPERDLFSVECGDFLKRYRDVGDSYPWHELVKHMTGKELSVDALKAEFEGLHI